MQGVWASKYNERAFLSMKKVGLNFLDLRMAVLVQRVVPAAYAFVIHTENPTNGAKDEIFAELVKGLGESIVSGMVPGSSLSFYAKKGSLDKPEVGFDTQTVVWCPPYFSALHCQLLPGCLKGLSVLEPHLMLVIQLYSLSMHCKLWCNNT